MTMPYPAGAARRASLAPLAGAGWGFLALGTLAVLAPLAAGRATVELLGAAMVLWGGFGAAAAAAMRPEAGGRGAALAFGLLAALGAAFLLFPAAGMEALALVIVAGLLLEGVASILFALRISGRERRWGWMLASGAAALAAGLAVLVGRPGTADWLVGTVLGLDFATTGVAMLALRRAALRPAA